MHHIYSKNVAWKLNFCFIKSAESIAQGCTKKVWPRAKLHTWCTMYILILKFLCCNGMKIVSFLQFNNSRQQTKNFWDAAMCNNNVSFSLPNKLLSMISKKMLDTLKHIVNYLLPCTTDQILDPISMKYTQIYIKIRL